MHVKLKIIKHDDGSSCTWAGETLNAIFYNVEHIFHIASGTFYLLILDPQEYLLLIVELVEFQEFVSEIP